MWPQHLFGCCLNWLAILNYKDCHFEFPNQRCMPFEESKVKILVSLNDHTGSPNRVHYSTLNDKHLIITCVFLCPCLMTSLVTYHSSIGVQLRRLITYLTMSCLPTFRWVFQLVSNDKGTSGLGYYGHKAYVSEKVNTKCLHMHTCSTSHSTKRCQRQVSGLWTHQWTIQWKYDMSCAGPHSWGLSKSIIGYSRSIPHERWGKATHLGRDTHGWPTPSTINLEYSHQIVLQKIGMWSRF